MNRTHMYRYGHLQSVSVRTLQALRFHRTKHQCLQLLYGVLVSTDITDPEYVRKESMNILAYLTSVVKPLLKTHFPSYIADDLINLFQPKNATQLPILSPHHVPDNRATVKHFNECNLR